MCIDISDASREPLPLFDHRRHFEVIRQVRLRQGIEHIQNVSPFRHATKADFASNKRMTKNEPTIKDLSHDRVSASEMIIPD